MLEVVIKGLSSLVMPISSFFVGKNIIENENKVSIVRILGGITFLSIFNFVVYTVKYEMLITLLNFIAVIISYKFMFKKSLLDTFILSIVLMILMFVSEIMFSIVLLPIFTAENLRSIGFPMLIANLCIGVMTILMSKIKLLKKLIKNLILKLEKNTKIKMIIFSLMWIVVTSVGSYMTANISTNNLGFWTGLCIQIVFMLFIINHYRDKNKYLMLNDKFDALYDYIETMEEYLDNERLNIHEYKNQLTVIRSMTKDNKVIKYIDSLVIKTKHYDDWSTQLINLPKGGFKGLLYYKITTAVSLGLNISVDISKGCKSFFENSSLEELKKISILLGIYLDNAIEAAQITDKKSISIEIYYNKKLNIVISNSFEQKVDLKSFSKKGYSTKGLGRGNGLYLATKIISKNSNLESYTKTINSYYVQKLIVHKK